MNYKKIKFIGGGRWASIVLNELLLNIKNFKVFLYRNSNRQTEINEQLKPFYLEKRLFINEVNQKEDNYDGIIIASNSLNHLNDLKNNLDYKVPILIEKPIFKNFDEYRNLTEFQKKYIFLNLEYLNAFYIQDFREEIKYRNIKLIKIIWHDPFIEKRKDSIKYSEVYTSIFIDQLLHITSILKSLGFNNNNLILDALIYRKNSDKIEIVNSYQDLKITISISRFSNNRKRKIIVNNNFELDFTKEPILIDKEKGLIKNYLKKNRLMPIAKTLKIFLLNNYKDERKNLSIEALLPEIKYCFKIQESFLNEFEEKIRQIKNKKFISKLGLKNYIYYLGIKYYEFFSKEEDYNLHFLKGYKGLRKLIKWGKSLDKYKQ